MHARKVFCDAFGLACEANPRLKYAYDELVSDEQLTLKDVYDLEGVKPLGMYATCPEPSIALTDPLCPSFAPLHSLCPSLHSLCPSFAPLHSLCPSLQSLCPSSSPPLLLPCPSLPLASHYLAVRGGLLRWHVDDELNRPFATGLFDIIIRNAFHKGVGGSATVIKAFHIAYILYLVPLSLYPQLPFSLPPNATYVPLLPLVQAQSLQAFRSPPPHPLPFLPNPPVCLCCPLCSGSHSRPSAHLILILYPSSQPHRMCLCCPLCSGSHSRPSAHLILALYPSSQPHLCASVAPYAVAVTPGLPLISSSPSTLPPNPTYVPLLPLMQWQSLQAFRSPHPRPLPFLPTPPMCLCCPFCSGSHSRPSAHLILALYPSSQPDLCASVAPCAGAVTPGLPLTSSSPSTLPPNPTYVPLLPLMQWQGSHSRPSTHLILALYPSSQPHLCASVAPYAVAVTPGLPLTSSSPSTLPPNPTYVPLLRLMQWQSLQAFRSPHPRPLPFLPTPPMCLCCPFCSGSHSRPSAHLILALYPSSQPHLCASVAPFAVAVTPGLPLTSSSPSTLPPNPTYVPLLPLLQWQGSHSRPSAHLILTLFPSSQPHLCASVAPCAGAVTPGLPLASSSPFSLPPNPTYVPLLPLVQGQSLQAFRSPHPHPLPFLPTPPMYLCCPLCRGSHSRPSAHLILTLFPSSQPYLCASVAPCAGAVEHGVQHHTTNGKKVSTDACVNHDQILLLHRKVKAAIKKYLDDTPDDQLSSWDADHQRWVFGPTGNVVISGSGFPNHIPDGADPDKRDKEEAEILVKYCRMQADKIEAKRGCQVQGDGRDDEDNEVGNWMDEGDDEY
ncbi:unnamed protein product [Closterium sp. NIES-65]|nr:unnamed protein product [Closterium sp. NIES-65]